MNQFWCENSNSLKNQNFDFCQFWIQNKIRISLFARKFKIYLYSQSATAPATCVACRRLARFARHYPWRSPSTHTPWVQPSNLPKYPFFDFWPRVASEVPLNRFDETFSRCLKITENSLIQNCERSLWKNAKNGQFWHVFENLKLAVKQYYRTTKS